MSDYTIIKEFTPDSWEHFVKDLMPEGEYHHLLKNCIWRGQRKIKGENRPLLAAFFRKHEHADEGIEVSEKNAWHDRDIRELANSLNNQYRRYMEYNFLSGSGLTQKLDNQDYYYLLKSKLANEGEISKRIEKYIFEPSPIDILWGREYDLNDWIWAQHYGVKTPLLDWTRFPYHALFFAYERNGLNTCTCGREIFALDIQMIKYVYDFFYKHEGNVDAKQQYYKRTLESSSMHTQWGTNICETVNRDMSLIKIIQEDSKNTRNNARIVRQGGVLTSVPFGKSIEKYLSLLEQSSVISILQKQIKEANNLYNCQLSFTPFLYKFTIPEDETARNDCLIHLNTMNINHATIYPDFEGLAKAVEMAESLSANITSNIRLY